jgi:coenzyme F420-0:L-glutamate ligase / coenzyme F420-1:gamma-L-glutamate ligase
MPEVLDAIKQRRSIRKYLPQQVPSELVDEVLVAAGWAPSAHNSQPWRFIILENTLVKRALADAMADAWAADLVKDGVKIVAKMREERVVRFANAPILILACSTMDGLRKFPDEKRQMCERDLAMQSLGAAMQNLLLMAHTRGLGGCWFCAPGFCKETVRKMLKIPDTVEPEAFVIMGYSAEIPLVPTKKSLGEYCFVDGWGKKL